MKMENVVQISAENYTAILEPAYKVAILQDVLFANAALGYKEKSLIFGANTDLDTVAKYLFPDMYAEKIAELKAAKEDDEQ